MEDKDIGELSEIEQMFKEQQDAATFKGDTLDFEHTIRTESVRPESPRTQVGKWIHKHSELVNESLKEPIPNLEASRKEVPLSCERDLTPPVYPDIVHDKDKMIRDIKPDNSSAIQSGLVRNEIYKSRMEAETGTTGWQSEIHTYNYDEMVKKHEWMKAADPTPNPDDPSDSAPDKVDDPASDKVADVALPPDSAIQEVKLESADSDVKPFAFDDLGSKDNETSTPAPLDSTPTEPEARDEADSLSLLEKQPEPRASEDTDLVEKLDYPDNYDADDNLVDGLNPQMNAAANNNPATSPDSVATTSVNDSPSSDLSADTNTGIDPPPTDSSAADSGFEANGW